MTDRQLRQYQMLLRLRDFGAAHAGRLPEGTLAGDAFAAIGDAVNRLNTHAVERLARRRESANAPRRARVALLKMMEGISRTARLLRAADPAFPATFLMPERRSAQAVLTTARLFARDEEPFAAQFVAHAFGATFPENFKRLLQDYEQAVEGRESGKGQTAASRASVEAAIASGFAAARKLDVVIANVLGDDSIVVAEWERNRRVGYRKPTTRPAPAAAATEPVDISPVEPPSPAVAADTQAPSIPTSSVTPDVTTTPPITLVTSSAPPPEETSMDDALRDHSADVPDHVPDAARARRAG